MKPEAGRVQRDLELRCAGYTVRRYTGAQLSDHPTEIAGELGELLGLADRD